MKESNPFYLLLSKRFFPFFSTQALGAFNDNLYKNALLIIISFTAASAMPFDGNIAVNLAAGLFMLPFFLFSALAGEIADKYDKAVLIRNIKLVEIIIMIIGAIGLWFEWYALLFIVLFLMGVQSAFFGPVKYSVIPQILHENEVVPANALVEMGTFVSILLGTIVGGLLAGLEYAHEWVAVGIIVAAIIGYLSSRSIPAVPASNPDLIIERNPLRQISTTLRIAYQESSVFMGILAISWFWFMGASYLTQFPNYTKTILQGDEQVVTLLLAVFSIGIAIGSLLTAKLSGQHLKLSLVVIGGIGLSMFGLDLSMVSFSSMHNEQGLEAFLILGSHLHILIDILLIGVSGGLFIVPLYALVQLRSASETRSQTIAALNIYNAIFMVLSAVFAGVALGLAQLSIPLYFAVLSVVNLLLLIVFLILNPEYVQRKAH
jgi:MFS family permease